MAKVSNITVKDIYNEIQKLNAGSYYRYERTMGEQLADSVGSLKPYLAEDSLAYKIYTTSKSYSAKQLWVIAYELIKSEAYVAQLIEDNRAYNEWMYGDAEIEC